MRARIGIPKITIGFTGLKKVSWGPSKQHFAKDLGLTSDSATGLVISRGNQCSVHSSLPLLRVHMHQKRFSWEYIKFDLASQ